MSLEVFRIPEWPYNLTTWVYLADAARVAGVTVGELREVCSTIGATIVRRGGNAHDRKHAPCVDFGTLGPSAAWKALLGAKESREAQQSLFA